MRKELITIALILVTCLAHSQEGYMDLSRQSSRLKELANGNKNFMKLTELAITAGGNPVHLVTLGGAGADGRPAVVVTGGVSGNHPLGTELAMRFIEEILENDSLTNSLSQITYYVFPNMSPDAMSQFYSVPQYERTGNSSDTDDDRDGRMNEDPFEDLNGDGLITMMRVEDNTGEWRSHETDERVMVKADVNEGEPGGWRMLTEGRDNDRDGRFNEDGEGGVAFNKNFTFDYPWFKPGAGEYQVSEVENRAMLDFLYERTNIFAFFSFGPSDNLSAPMKYNAQDARKRVVSSILRSDAAMNKLLSDRYAKLTGQESRSAKTYPGGYMQWAYFHFGRFSFSTPGYYIPDLKDKGENLSEEANALRWYDSLGNERFADWQSVEHPDFPGRKVEVGGMHPFAMLNPPAMMIDSLGSLHAGFITGIASMRPRAQLENIEVVPVGRGVYRVSVDLYNSGRMPALSEMGERVKWVMKPKVNLKMDSGMSLVSGNAVTLLDQLEAGGSRQLSWLIRGKGNVQISAGAPQMGVVNLDVELN